MRRFPRTVCHRGPPRFFCSICTSNLADSGANLSNQVSHRWLPHCDNLRRPRVPGVKSREEEEEATSFRNIFGHSFLTQRKCLENYGQEDKIKRTNKFLINFPRRKLNKISRIIKIFQLEPTSWLQGYERNRKKRYAGACKPRKRIL